MNHFQTVAIFTYPSEMAIARSFLESNNIECFVKDELTIQVHNFYSNAIGGIKMQVKQQDFKKARHLLLQRGFIKDENVDHNGLLPKLDALTSKIPLIGSLSFPSKMISLFVMLLSMVIIPALYFIIPTTSERLTNSDWCVSHVSFNGKNYVPSTDRVRIILNGHCIESVKFKVNGSLVLPGFESDFIIGQWVLEGDKVELFGIDNFANIYDGIYDLNFDGSELTMTSENTILYCFRQ